MAMNRIDQPIMAADDSFVEQAGRRLRDGVKTLDATTRSRLNRARRKALLELRDRSRMQRWIADQWGPAVGATFIALLAAGLWFGVGMQTASENMPMQTAGAPVDLGDLADLDMLLADENLEMIEDLQFYLWMDAELTRQRLKATG
ncbi:MAG: hypothetical protein VX533_05705 [Pseudomonadota bacterium]|nr:hypothetical protein [Pseudomonadota bacterium]